MIDMAYSSRQTSTTVAVSLSSIIDLVNNIYLFSDISKDIDILFANQFKIARKIADSGIWWRTWYGMCFHTAIKQIVSRADEVPVFTRAGSKARISKDEACQLLPCIGFVQEIVEIWRDERQPENVRKDKIASFFPEDVRRIIEPHEGGTVVSQFYEEGYDKRGNPIYGFFEYLDACPLSEDSMNSVTLVDAVKYWGWLDNIRAFRTILREDNAKNVRLRRMQQAVQLYHLVERIREETGVDFSYIPIPSNSQLMDFLKRNDLYHIAVISDTYGLNPYITYSSDIFINSSSLGSAIKELLQQIIVKPDEYIDCITLFSLILRSAIKNIVNHEDLLSDKTNLAVRDINPDYGSVCQKISDLLHHIQDNVVGTGDTCTGLIHSLGDSYGADKKSILLSSSLFLFIDTLTNAKLLTDFISAHDPQSSNSSIGLCIILDYINKHTVHPLPHNTL